MEDTPIPTNPALSNEFNHLANLPAKRRKAKANIRRDGKSPIMQVAIKGLLDAGFDRKKIINALGIRGWAEKTFGKTQFAGGLENQPWFDAVANKLAESCYLNAGAALVQVAEKLPEASALQAATIAGIMIDKNAVLRGKTNQTPVATIHLVAVIEVARLEAELRAMDEAVVVEVLPDETK